MTAIRLILILYFFCACASKPLTEEEREAQRDRRIERQSRIR